MGIKMYLLVVPTTHNVRNLLSLFQQTSSGIIYFQRINFRSITAMLSTVKPAGSTVH